MHVYRKRRMGNYPPGRTKPRGSSEGPYPHIEFGRIVLVAICEMILILIFQLPIPMGLSTILDRQTSSLLVWGFSV